MNVRELYLDDMFLLLEIIDDMGMQEEIKRLFNPETVSGVTKEELIRQQNTKGFELVVKALFKSPKSKEKIYTFISGLTDIPTEDVRKLGLKQLKELYAAIKESVGASDFLGFLQATDTN